VCWTEARDLSTQYGVSGIYFSIENFRITIRCSKIITIIRNFNKRPFSVSLLSIAAAYAYSFKVRALATTADTEGSAGRSFAEAIVGKHQLKN